MRNRVFPALICLLIISTTSHAQTTAFTYQGKLADNNGVPLAGNFDFQFKLFDASSLGLQVGATLTLDGTGANPPFVVVTSGIFTVTLDFGSAVFSGAARFLEIAVKPHGGGSFTTLAPRQPISSTPYAVKSMTAATADGLSVACVNCVTSSQIGSVNGSAVTGTIPVASVPAGSTNYIQNSPNPQSQALFDISSGHFAQSVRIEGSGFFIPNTPSLSLSSSGSVQVDAPFLPGGRLAILENGNVGIANGAPAEKLHVVGNGLFSGNVTVNGTLNGNGSGLTSLNASNFATGTLLTARGGTGLGSPGLNGNFLRSNGTSWTSSSIQGSDLPAGSANYIRNLTIAGVGQTADFNVTGNGRIGGLFQIDGSGFPPGGRLMVLQSGNVGIGLPNPLTKLEVDGIIKSSNAGAGVQFADRTSFGFGFSWTWYASDGLVHLINSSGPLDLLRVNDFGDVEIGGTLKVGGFGSGGASLCSSVLNPVIGFCSSSIRYKKDVHAFALGLDLISRLRPVSFNWKTTNEGDMGLIAEEVAEIEPLLVTHNAKGQIEGVKYERVGVVLINAVKEQQQQIDALKRIVCLDHPTAEFCKDPKGDVTVSKSKP